MYHGNTLVIANAIQSKRLGTEKTTIFTWGCRRIATISTGHKQATLGTQRTPGAYLAERSAELRPVVPEPHFCKRLVPRIAVPEFVRHVPRRASLPVPSPELRARREELADAPPFPPTAAQCSGVRPSRSTAFGSAPHRRSTRIKTSSR